MRFIMWVLLLSSALVAGNSQHLEAMTSDPQTIVPFKAQIVEGAGKDWNVIAFELAPGTNHSWRSQARGEFLYVLEGAGRLEVDGKRAMTLNSGSVSTLTSTPHHVLKNTSRTKTLKILVVFFNDNSDPHPLLASTLMQGLQGTRDGPPNGENKPRIGQHRPGDIGLVF